MLTSKATACKAVLQPPSPPTCTHPKTDTHAQQHRTTASNSECHIPLFACTGCHGSRPTPHTINGPRGSTHTSLKCMIVSLFDGIVLWGTVERAQLANLANLVRCLGPQSWPLCNFKRMGVPSLGQLTHSVSQLAPRPI